MTAIYDQLVDDYSAITYEAWINLMVRQDLPSVFLLNHILG
jgi:hypothetical protein